MINGCEYSDNERNDGGTDAEDEEIRMMMSSCGEVNKVLVC